MSMLEIIEILKAAGAVTSVGNTVYKIIDWLQRKQHEQLRGDDLQAALSQLAKNASAEDVLSVLQPFLRGASDVILAAGDDNGGDLIASGLEVQAGPGGKVVVAGGNGGANGKGGTVTISSSKLSGGSPF